MDGSSDKKYYIHINKKVKIEVSKEQYIQHHKEREHHKYLKKEERKVTIMSYEGLGENLSAEDIISDWKVDVEESAIKNIMIESLHNAIKTLSQEELLLIDRLIYQEKSERKVASEIGISHTAVGKRWDKLLRKLRDLLNE